MMNVPFRLIILLGLFPFTTISLVAQPVHNIWGSPPKQGIAAQVEDEIITFEDIRREMGPLVRRIQEEARSQREFEMQMHELYREVLQSLVDRVLIVKEFHEREFQIPQSVIENEFDRILIEDFGNDRARFHEHLRELGMNVREFRRDLRERIIVSVMRGRMRRSESEVSPERIERFYHENKIHFYEEESVHLRIIMLRPIADEGPDLLRQNAEKVIRELEEGKPFRRVAAEYSQDARSDRGGDWGWNRRGDLRDELSQAAFALEPGEWSEPISVGDQIFILYVEDVREEGIQPLHEVRERIEEILASQIARQTQQSWLERLRKDAFVKFY